MRAAMELAEDENSARPNEAWAKLRPDATVMRFKTKHPKEPAPKDKVRVVCVSDTHSLTSHMKRSAVPDGDVLVHAGDFTKCGRISEVRKFNDWLGSLPHKHKVVIAGNHELSFDTVFAAAAAERDGDASTKNAATAIVSSNQGLRSHHLGDDIGITSPRLSSAKQSSSKLGFAPTLGLDKEELESALEEVSSPAEMKSLLTNCTYLEDSSVTIHGIKFYGTPWQPHFHGWAFNLKRGRKLLDKWDLIPDDTDVLITHTPPVGYGDLCATGDRVGCVDLLNTVQRRVKPKYHIYGHIHEGYGVRSDGKTVFINASACDLAYTPSNKAIVFDMPLPKGFTKESAE